MARNLAKDRFLTNPSEEYVNRKSNLIDYIRAKALSDAGISDEEAKALGGESDSIDDNLALARQVEDDMLRERIQRLMAAQEIRPPAGQASPQELEAMRGMTPEIADKLRKIISGKDQAPPLPEVPKTPEALAQRIRTDFLRDPTGDLVGSPRTSMTETPPTEEWQKWNRAKTAADTQTGQRSLAGAAKQMWLGATEPSKYDNKFSEGDATRAGMSMIPMLPFVGGSVPALAGAGVAGALPDYLAGRGDARDVAASAAENVALGKLLPMLLGGGGGSKNVAPELRTISGPPALPPPGNAAALPSSGAPAGLAAPTPLESLGNPVIGPERQLARPKPTPVSVANAMQMQLQRGRPEDAGALNALATRANQYTDPGLTLSPNTLKHIDARDRAENAVRLGEGRQADMFGEGFPNYMGAERTKQMELPMMMGEPYPASISRDQLLSDVAAELGRPGSIQHTGRMRRLQNDLTGLEETAGMSPDILRDFIARLYNRPFAKKGAKVAPLEQMQQLEIPLQIVERGRKAKPQFTNLSPYGKLGDVDRFPFAKGGKV